MRAAKKRTIPAATLALARGSLAPKPRSASHSPPGHACPAPTWLPGEDRAADRGGAATMRLRDTPVWETPAVIVGPFGTSLGFKALPAAVTPALPASGSLPQGLLSATSSLHGSLRHSGSIQLKERKPAALAPGGPAGALEMLDVRPGSGVQTGGHPGAGGGGPGANDGGGGVARVVGGGGGARGRGARRGSMAINGAPGDGVVPLPRTSSGAEQAGPVRFSSGIPQGAAGADAVRMGAGNVGNVQGSTGPTNAHGAGFGGPGGGRALRLVAGAGRRASWSMHESELDGGTAAALVQGGALGPSGGSGGGVIGAGEGVAALEGGLGPGVGQWGAPAETAARVRVRFRARREKPSSFRGPDMLV